MNTRALILPSRVRNCSTCNFFGRMLGWWVGHILYDCAKGGSVTGIGRCNWWELQERQMEFAFVGGKMISRRSEGTTDGMRRWYRSKVPKCRKCRRVYLVEHPRRKLGLCAKCESKESKDE